MAWKHGGAEGKEGARVALAEAWARRRGRTMSREGARRREEGSKERKSSRREDKKKESEEEKKKVEEMEKDIKEFKKHHEFTEDFDYVWSMAQEEW